MSRAPWRRFRATDLPRPAGRRWAGLRRGGSLARQVLRVARITRHSGEPGAIGTTALVAPDGATAESTGVRRVRLASIRRVRRHDAPGRALGHGMGVATSGLPIPVSPAIGHTPGQAGGSLAGQTPGHVSDRGRQMPVGSLRIPLLPGDRTPIRRMRFIVVNAFTLASMLLGMSAVFVAFRTAQVHWAAACLIGCVVLDGLDGALARRLGVASPFGAQMDSLADMCSFGVAAPVVVYAGLVANAPATVVAPACGLVTVCAAIRLARFNVSPKDGRFFCGVPTTMAAAVLALDTLIAQNMPVWLRVTAVAVLALAMVSSFPYAKLASLLRLPPWLWIIPMAGAIVDYRLTFSLTVVAYLISGPLIWAASRRRDAAPAGLA